MCLDRAAVDRNPFRYRFRATGLTKQQVKVVLGGKADRVRALRPDPQGRVRFLHRRRLDDDILVVPVLAVMRKPALTGPGLAQEGDGFLVALLGFLHRDAEPVELAPAITLADAEIEPAVREKIEGRGLLGQQRRIVPGQY